MNNAILKLQRENEQLKEELAYEKNCTNDAREQFFKRGNDINRLKEELTAERAFADGQLRDVRAANATIYNLSSANTSLKFEFVRRNSEPDQVISKKIKDAIRNFEIENLTWRYHKK